jgi:hypothetical protein
MSTVNRHIIQQFAIEVRCNDKEVAGKIHRELPHVIKDDLMKELEAVMDSVPAHIHLRIDRLELDLGALSSDRYAIQFREALIGALRKELDQWERNGKKGEGTITVSQHLWEQFRFFVEKGYWPWWAKTDAVEELAQALEDLWKKQGLSPTQEQRIRQWIIEKDSRLQRLVLQFPAALLGVLLEKLAPNTIRKWVQQQLRRQARKAHPGIWATAFQLAVEKPKMGMRDVSVWKLLARNLQDLGMTRQEVQDLKGLAVEIESTGPKEMEIKTDAPFLEEPVFINMAGLVLIAPFLPRFFSNCGLLEDKVFKSREHQVRAIHLLYHVATGQDEAPEHELVLCKLLCHYPVQMPVPLSGGLTDHEKEQTIELLHAVIGNWDKIQNTSIDNFRGSFLIRDGMLKDTGEQFTLQVERKAYDILLESLPWAYGLVKLPWMSKMITVTW